MTQCVRKISAAVVGGLALAVTAGFPVPAMADEGGTRSQVWDIARGGQLYDNWAKVLGKELPKETHPAYPSTGKQKGDATWRCKECHGWDYKGADGAYAKGSHQTGIKGLRAMVGADPKAIVKILTDNTHRYTEDMIGRGEMEKLALFVSLGQIDMDLHIDRATRKSRGEAGRGAPYYQTICAVCHGFDGKTLNFRTPEDPEYVGTIARENPWEFMHKARFGQPGIPMISLITQPDAMIADLLALSQTLPEK
ncbi:hypothetical protein [Aromatoleum toluclasticum]|uniref:hypothetical protein n=1 Tax=Aromatoleum toluclasticum TaxID=92003 RepID=UPI00038115E0|nr:hypothetical protein [Aromatoleum toluclasticum]